MKIIKTEYEQNAIFELKADDITTLCNALSYYRKNADMHSTDLINSIKNIYIQLQTANNICQYAQPLITKTMKIVERWEKLKDEKSTE